MYDHSLQSRRKHFCRHYLHALITDEVLNRNSKDCFKFIGKQRIKIPLKKVNTLYLKIVKEK